MKKHLFSLTAIMILFGTACQNNQQHQENTATQTQEDSTKTNKKPTMAESLIGKWIQPIPGQEAEKQGMQLNADGSASSINIHTLIYEKWQLKGDTLLLSYHTEGVKTTGSYVDTVLVKNLTDSTLALTIKGAADMNYTREK
ncbi:lipocalin-like protein [Chitinophaga polysaccharea]|uniref:Lipocalin-like protein n=1 Tax=Chitinophaga polysaccharea TaxID=1293035 RepID=A0A561PA92_9BACT|nr:lipocalin family protein [Chitinophaga polysaccharea]TWF34980.1 lipocalin-like protein [Chitinophaga polysaccharea]